MTKKINVLILLLLFVSLILCGCISQPLQEQVIETNTNTNFDDTNYNANTSNPTNTDDDSAKRTLYVSGAVQTDGYVTIPQLCDYKTVLEIVGLTECSLMPEDVTRLVDEGIDHWFVDYTYDGINYLSVNVNGVYVITRATIEGLDPLIVNKLADYIEAYGTITNRDQLRLALGDCYESNYYKFYIDQLDYAQGN